MALTPLTTDVAGVLAAANAHTPSKPLAELASTNVGEGSNDKKTNAKDDTWFWPDVVEGTRWDKQFPYQFIVLNRNSNGGYEQRGDWVFTLPIPPESLVLDVPTAISTTPTQGGIVEEHNAAPLRMIEISGTTGVLPIRPSPGQPGTSPFLASVFAGTINAAQETASTFQDIVLDLTGDQRRPDNLIPDELLQDTSGSNTLLRNTGYWQFRMMQRFLEGYLNLKRSDAGQNSVLAVAVWKDEAVYLITPKRWTFRKMADSPMEWRYQLSLTAFGRVQLKGPGPIREAPGPDPRNPSTLNAILNAMTDSRRTLNNARETIEAVLGDVDHAIFEPIREATLLIKDALGLPIALIDLPASIVKDAADTVGTALANGEDILDFPKTVTAEAARTTKSISEDVNRIKASWKTFDDRTSVSSAASRLGQAIASSFGGAVRAVTNIFDNPNKHAPLMSAIRPDRLKLPASVSEAIRQEIGRVRNLSKNDLEARRQRIIAASATFEDNVGAGNPIFAETYNYSTPHDPKPFSPHALAISGSMAKAWVGYSGLVNKTASNSDASFNAGLNNFASSAAKSGIPFTPPNSKYPVPISYGTTIEQLAQRYLGTPNRAIEIIALNGLRAPYIDEVGRKMTMLAPGSGRTVVVQDDPDLYIGQTIWVESNAQPHTKRHITGINRSNGQATLSVDGDANLSIYSTLQNASIHIFAPNTVNSQMLVFIPSSAPPDGAFRVSGVAGLNVFDSLTSAGGVDLLLTPSNDLIVTPDGDGRWATGLQNLVQNFRILVTLRRGTLLYHPDKGLPIRPGDSIADVDINAAARAIRETLAAEPAFTLIRAIQIVAKPPVITLNIVAEVSGTDMALPLSIDLVR